VQGFGEPPTAKSQMLNLIKSIRTVMRGKYRDRLTHCYCCTIFLHNALIFSSSDILQYLDINCEARARLIGKRCRNVYEWNVPCVLAEVLEMMSIQENVKLYYFYLYNHSFYPTCNLRRMLVVRMDYEWNFL